MTPSTPSHPRIFTVTLNPALDLSTEAAAVRPNTKLRCAAPRSQPGGGGVNVSRAITALGGQSRAVIAAGGHEGRVLISELRRAGMDPLVIRVDGATRASLSVIDQDSGDQFRFVMPGPDWGEDDDTRLRAALRGALRPGDIVVPSGSLPPGARPDLFSRLAGEMPGIDMVLDTSGPALEAAARGQGLHTLRMDDDEARALSGQPCDTIAEIAALARGLYERGAARHVLIAAGAQGTVLWDESGGVQCAPPKVRVRSKTGAGDSFVAAYTWALAQGQGARAACVAGTAAAAAAVETPDSDLCDRAATERYVPLVVQSAL